MIQSGEFNDLINEWWAREGRGVTEKDIPFLLGFVAEAANRSEDLQEDAAGWNMMFQFNIGPSLKLWLSVKAGRFAAGLGMAEHPDITLLIPAGRIGYYGTDMDENTPPSNCADIFLGLVSVLEAYSIHKIKIVGSLADLQKFADTMEWVRHDLDLRQTIDYVKNRPKIDRNEVLDDCSIKKKRIPVRISMDEAIRRLMAHFTYEKKGVKHEVSKIEILSPNLKKITLSSPIPEGVLRPDVMERVFPTGKIEREIYIRNMGDESEVIIIGETGPWGPWSFGKILKALQ